MVTSISRRTAPRIAVVNGKPTTTSRDIAETFGKRHDNVVRLVQNLECSAEFSALNFEAAEYTDAQGKPRTEYRITRDGFAFLCMGFTGAKAAGWKEKYINTFNRLADAAHAVHTAKPAAAIDPAALLLSGQSDAPLVLTDAQQAAVDKQAWLLAHEAYQLARQHITRRIAYETTAPQRLQRPSRVQAVVDGVTLGNALAHKHHLELRSVLRMMHVARDLSAECVDSLEQLIKEGGK